MSRSAHALLFAILVLAGASAHAGTDASFLLRAELKDLPAYFPGYLGNGYLGTLTAPRGTESTPTYVIAFMDYTTGDMSRPADLVVKDPRCGLARSSSRSDTARNAVAVPLRAAESWARTESCLPFRSNSARQSRRASAHRAVQSRNRN